MTSERGSQTKTATVYHLWREEEQKVVIEDNNNESTDIDNYGNGRQMANYIALHFKLC